MLKDIPRDIFSGFNEEIWPKLRNGTTTTTCSSIRLPVDRIPDERVFVYSYLTDDFLGIVRRKRVSVGARKRILKAALRGIVELHDRDIAHLGRKLEALYALESFLLYKNKNDTKLIFFLQISSQTISSSTAVMVLAKTQ